MDSAAPAYGKQQSLRSDRGFNVRGATQLLSVTFNKVLAALSGSLFHLLSQAEGPHVSPHFLDISQALFFAAAFARIFPAQRVFTVCRPDGILLFMLYYNLVD